MRPWRGIYGRVPGTGATLPGTVLPLPGQLPLVYT